MWALVPGTLTPRPGVWEVWDLRGEAAQEVWVPAWRGGAQGTCPCARRLCVPEAARTGRTGLRVEATSGLGCHRTGSRQRSGKGVSAARTFRPTRRHGMGPRGRLTGAQGPGARREDQVWVGWRPGQVRGKLTSRRVLPTLVTVARGPLCLPRGLSSAKHEGTARWGLPLVSPPSQPCPGPGLQWARQCPWR